jgi:uncharacterized protein
MRYLICTAAIFFVIACHQPTATQKEQPGKSTGQASTRLYASAIGDSFTVWVSLPPGYDTQPNKHYPVVYLLDANLYFDIMAPVLNKYCGVGLAPEVIVVGIGYKDFATMDSLRNRDYTYPTAIPEYEMAVSGGADKFLSFVTKELLPYTDTTYRTDTANRILAGHSLGGYFTLYALQQQLAGRHNGFGSYISASPSLHYNNYYLLNQLKAIPATKSNRKINVYVTYGGLEESNPGEEPGAIKLTALAAQLKQSLSSKQHDGIKCKVDIYSNFHHMDTPIPSFLKGLQWMEGEGEGE